jgi:cyclopropane fatty-acyl-phospholipid synthase-like methyltransferase
VEQVSKRRRIALRVVERGYDRIAERYALWLANEVTDQVRPRYTALLLDTLPPDARVLELGCGGGGPTTRRLAERFVLTGVDISARQIELARQNVSGATFVHADMTRLTFPPSGFDAVAAFYALTHLPHGELPHLLHRITAWLRPGGLFVASMGGGSDPGTVEPNWLGAPMYFSGYPPEESQRVVAQAGLELLSAQDGTIVENGHPTTFLWVLARKPDSTA